MAIGKRNTLWSVLVIVAIIVVIAAIVIPMQRTRNTHDNLLSALDAASGAKLAVAEAAVVAGSAPSKLDAADIPWNPGKVDTPYAASIDIGDGGQVTVVTRRTGAKPDPTLVLTPVPGTRAGTIEWQCTVAIGNPSILPERCSAPTTADKPAGNASAAVATSTGR